LFLHQELLQNKGIRNLEVPRARIPNPTITTKFRNRITKSKGKREKGGHGSRGEERNRRARC
jgi:hypothetical protein